MKALDHLPAVETHDVRPRRVLLALSIVFVLMVGCVAVAVGVVLWTKPARELPQQDELRLGVRLEVDPQADDHRIENQTEKRLAEAGWNDEAHTSAHIPIDQAMELLARQGWSDEVTGRQRGPQP